MERPEQCEYLVHEISELMWLQFFAFTVCHAIAPRKKRLVNQVILCLVVQSLDTKPPCDISKHR